MIRTGVPCHSLCLTGESVYAIQTGFMITPEEQSHGKSGAIQAFLLLLPELTKRLTSPLHCITLAATFISSPSLSFRVRRNRSGKFSEPVRTRSIPTCEGNPDCLHRATNKEGTESSILLHAAEHCVYVDFVSS